MLSGNHDLNGDGIEDFWQFHLLDDGNIDCFEIEVDGIRNRNYWSPSEDKLVTSAAGDFTGEGADCIAMVGWSESGPVSFMSVYKLDELREAEGKAKYHSFETPCYGPGNLPLVGLSFCVEAKDEHTLRIFHQPIMIAHFTPFDDEIDIEFTSSDPIRLEDPLVIVGSEIDRLSVMEYGDQDALLCRQAITDRKDITFGYMWYALVFEPQSFMYKGIEDIYYMSRVVKYWFEPC